MDPRERVTAAVRGEPVDRVPFAVWRHFYPDENEGARKLAETTVAFTKRHQLDLVKYNPRAQYHAEPWGTRYEYSGADRPRAERHAVERAEDWGRIERRGIDEPAFTELLEGLRLVRDALADLPLVATIFTPIAVASYLVGHERIVEHVREHPERVLAALDPIADTFRDLAAACCEIADGIFLATLPLASRDILTDAEYARFGTPYDLRVLEGARGAPLNVLHVCGENAPVVELGSSYDVAAVSWNVHGRANPGLDVFLARAPGRAAIGGLSEGAFLEASRDTAMAEARFGRSITRGRRWICAGPCTISVESRPEAIDAARDALAA